MTSSNTRLGDLKISIDKIGKGSVLHTRNPGFPGMHLRNTVSSSPVRFNFSELHAFINTNALNAALKIVTDKPIIIAEYTTNASANAALTIASGTSTPGFGGYLPIGNFDIGIALTDVMCKRATTENASVAMSMYFTEEEDDTNIFDYS